MYFFFICKHEIQVIFVNSYKFILLRYLYINKPQFIDFFLIFFINFYFKFFEMRKSEGKQSSSCVWKTFVKALGKESEWNDKDELLDALYWGRQIISLCIGILWGVVPLKGMLAILIYVALSTLIGHFYVTSFQNQDADNFGGFWELAKEGFGAAFATFMVSWITIYSAVHFLGE